MACSSSPGRAQLFLGSPNLRQFISATNTTRSLPLVVRKPTRQRSLINVAWLLKLLTRFRHRLSTHRWRKNLRRESSLHSRVGRGTTSSRYIILTSASRDTRQLFVDCASICVRVSASGRSDYLSEPVARSPLTNRSLRLSESPSFSLSPFPGITDTESSIVADFPLIARCDIHIRVFDHRLRSLWHSRCYLPLVNPLLKDGQEESFRFVSLTVHSIINMLTVASFCIKRFWIHFYI